MRKLKVTHKLILTFSAILILFLSASFLLLNQITTVMRNLDYFYVHPFQVTNTSRDIKAELLAMRVNAKDIIMDNTAGQIETLLKKIEAGEQKVLKDIDLLDQSYLGDHAELTLLREKFHAWQAVTDKVIELASSGDDTRCGKTVHE